VLLMSLLLAQPLGRLRACLVLEVDGKDAADWFCPVLAVVVRNTASARPPTTRAPCVASASSTSSSTPGKPSPTLNTPNKDWALLVALATADGSDTALRGLALSPVP
jgi:hypothetical protein